MADGSHATDKKVYVGRCINYYPKAGVACFRIETQTIEEGDRFVVIGPTSGPFRDTWKECFSKKFRSPRRGGETNPRSSFRSAFARATASTNSFRRAASEPERKKKQSRSQRATGGDIAWERADHKKINGRIFFFTRGQLLCYADQQIITRD